MILSPSTINKRINNKIRKTIAMACRLIRRSLILNKIPPPVDEFRTPAWKSYVVWSMVVLGSIFFWIALVILLMTFSPTKAHAQEFTNTQIVNAIYLAEGGSHAQFAYGIRSVRYGSIEEARRICFRTIKHYRRKYGHSSERRNEGFVEYVQSHYCPTKGDLSNTEKKLNRYWIKNVMYFLRKGKT